MEMIDEQALMLLRRAIGLAAQARARGNHPFGALLADAQGRVLLQAENSVVTDRDVTAHAESNLVRLAWRSLDPRRLADCTLFTSTEPCAMCAGAIHWAGIGRVVYALSSSELDAIVGAGHNHLRLPCREVFARAQHPIGVLGPALEQEARAVHLGFWETLAP